MTVTVRYDPPNQTLKQATQSPAGQRCSRMRGRPRQYSCCCTAEVAKFLTRSLCELSAGFVSDVVAVKLLSTHASVQSDSEESRRQRGATQAGTTSKPRKAPIRRPRAVSPRGFVKTQIVQLPDARSWAYQSRFYRSTAPFETLFDIYEMISKTRKTSVNLRFAERGTCARFQTSPNLPRKSQDSSALLRR